MRDGLPSRQCDNCVDGIDHHCAYLHNCVGRNNYTSFIAFLVFTVLSLIWVAIWSAVYLWRAAVTRGLTFRAVLGDEAGSGVVFCLSLVLLLPVGSLMSYHVWVREPSFCSPPALVDRSADAPFLHHACAAS
jgi:palmitoyltransferase ZDHHC9/14/18